jgi:hypothetical protein
MIGVGAVIDDGADIKDKDRLAETNFCRPYDPPDFLKSLPHALDNNVLLAGQPLTPADLAETGGDPHQFNVLFLAHCTRGKGLFETLDAGSCSARASLVRHGRASLPCKAKSYDKLIPRSGRRFSAGSQTPGPRGRYVFMSADA